MRTVLISLAAAASALAIASPASAQYVPVPQGQAYGYHNNYGQVRALQIRIDRIQRQIAHFDRRNIITDREARRLRDDSRDAAACCGLTKWRTLWRIELPLAWPGIVSALVLTFAHTLGEFGVVLMVGGNIPGETRTIAVAIYDRVQAFDEAAAAVMSATLLTICLGAIAATYFTGSRVGRRHRA